MQSHVEQAVLRLRSPTVAASIGCRVCISKANKAKTLYLTGEGGMESVDLDAFEMTQCVFTDAYSMHKQGFPIVVVPTSTIAISAEYLLNATKMDAIHKFGCPAPLISSNWPVCDSCHLELNNEWGTDYGWAGGICKFDQLVNKEKCTTLEELIQEESTRINLLKHDVDMAKFMDVDACSRLNDVRPVQHILDMTQVLCGKTGHIRTLHSQNNHPNANVAMLLFTNREKHTIRVMVFSSSNILTDQSRMLRSTHSSGMTMRLHMTYNEVDCKSCHDKMHLIMEEGLRSPKWHWQKCFLCGKKGGGEHGEAHFATDVKHSNGLYSNNAYYGLVHDTCMWQCCKCKERTLPIMGPDPMKHSCADSAALVRSECVACENKTSKKPLRLVAPSSAATNTAKSTGKRTSASQAAKMLADAKAMPPPAVKTKAAKQMLLHPQKASAEKPGEEIWDLATRSKYDPKTESMHTMAEDNKTRLPVGNHRFALKDGTFVRQPRLDQPPTEYDNN
jgi:hypothetical protein